MHSRLWGNPRCLPGKEKPDAFLPVRVSVMTSHYLSDLGQQFGFTSGLQRPAAPRGAPSEAARALCPGYTLSRHLLVISQLSAELSAWGCGL